MPARTFLVSYRKAREGRREAKQSPEIEREVRRFQVICKHDLGEWFPKIMSGSSFLGATVAAFTPPRADSGRLTGLARRAPHPQGGSSRLPVIPHVRPVSAPPFLIVNAIIFRCALGARVGRAGSELAGAILSPSRAKASPAYFQLHSRPKTGHGGRGAPLVSSPVRPQYPNPAPRWERAFWSFRRSGPLLQGRAGAPETPNRSLSPCYAFLLPGSQIS